MQEAINAVSREVRSNTQRIILHSTFLLFILYLNNPHLNLLSKRSLFLQANMTLGLINIILESC